MLKAIRDLAAAREKAIRVIEKLRGLRLSRAAELVEAAIEETLALTTPSRRSIGGGFAPTIRSCVRSGGAPASWAHSLMVNSALNLAAARLRHIAGTT